MAIRRSTALVNALAQGYGVRELLRDGVLYMFKGAIPADADTATSASNLLATYTAGGAAHTEATRAFTTITIGGSATGTLDTIKVGGMGFNLLSEAISYTSSASNTAALVVANINARQNPLNIVAEQSTADVILRLPYWVGANGNGLTCATTVSGSLTASVSGAFASGVTALNGLNFLEAISTGVLTKDASVWQSTASGSGFATWFRFCAGGSVAGYAAADTAPYDQIRFDGTVGSGTGYDMNISSTSVTAGAVYVIANGTITEPLTDPTP